MVTQKLISFKVNEDLLYHVDKIVKACDGRLSYDGTPVRVNRNKLINLALETFCFFASFQIDVLKQQHKESLLPNSMSSLVSNK